MITRSLRSKLTDSLRLLAVLVTCHMSLATSPLAQAATASFDIPAQPAPAAINLFIRQSGTQVVYIHDDVRDVRTKAVSGQFEAKIALELLLKDTSLTFTERKGGQFTVGRLKPGSIDGSIRDEAGKPVVGARVGLADTDKTVLTDRRGRFSLSDVSAGAHVLHISAEGMQNTRVTDVVVKSGQQHSLSPITVPVKVAGTLQLDDFVVSAKKNDGVVELDPYSVEGRKEKVFSAGNMDIPRGIDDVQPYYIISADQISRSATANVEDLLKQQLTMNTVSLTFSQTASSTSGTRSTIDLRGLGADKTLILVNGRRMAGVSIRDTEFQPDLNGIPLGAIERIEVLPSSASGIYGGSALGGVVNIILKQNYRGGEISLNYHNTWDSDAPRRTASLSYGFGTASGKTNFSVNASWSDAKQLLLADRADIYRSNLDVINQRLPTFIYSNADPVLGALPNIAANTTVSGNLTLKQGNIPLNSRVTYIPAGTAPTITASQLAPGLLGNAGRWELNLPLSTQSPTGLLRPFGSTPESWALRMGVRQQIGRQVEAHTEYAVSTNRSRGYNNSGAESVLTVGAAAPTNPFNQSVLVRIPDAGVYPVTTFSKNHTATLGLIARLPSEWTAAADYTWSENRFDYTQYAKDTAGMSAALASGALNPFVDTLVYPLDLQRYLSEVNYRGSNELHDFALRGNGPLPWPSWGAVRLTTGLERRISLTPERVERTVFPISVANSFTEKFYERETVADSGYLEASIPLIKAAWLPGLHTLEAQLSGRSERLSVQTGTTSERTLYNRTPPTTTYGGTLLNGQPYYSEASYTSSNYTVGLKYAPVRDVVFRISRATAFLPPTPAQLIKNPLPAAALTQVTDPKLSNTIYGVQTVTGGNPDLKPQNSESLNAGLIWNPQAGPFKGLRLNAEYYFIEQFDAITTLSAQVLVNQEDAFPDRIIRDAAGRITLVDRSSLNLFSRKSEGWDFSLGYSRETPIGRFSLQAMQSLILKLQTQYLQTLPAYEGAGYPNEGGAAKRKGNLSLTWERKGWSAGWSTSYFGEYYQYGVAGGPNSVRSRNGAVYDGRFTVVGGGEVVPPQTYHDVSLGYTFGNYQHRSERRDLLARVANGLSLQVGVRNVFNDVPPLDPFYGGTYYLSPYGDIRLRTYWINLKRSF